MLSAKPRGPAPSRKARSGFTLLEMLVVITIIGVLATVVGPMVFRNVGDAKASAARSQLQIFELALEAYRLDTGYYPTTAEGLEALVKAPPSQSEPGRWRGPYLKRAVPRDPWSHPYQYASPTTEGTDGYELLSFGRDGARGGIGEDSDLVAGGEPVK